MLEGLNGQTIRVNGSVLGFESLNEFVLESKGTDSPFALLQSQEDKNIGFIVASPFTFFKDYTFELDAADKEQLALTSPEQALILGIITVRDPFTQSTMNLVAPVVVNITTMNAKQIVLSPHYEYSTKTAIFELNRDVSGDESC